MGCWLDGGLVVIVAVVYGWWLMVEEYVLAYVIVIGETNDRGIRA